MTRSFYILNYETIKNKKNQAFKNKKINSYANKRKGATLGSFLVFLRLS